MDVTFAPQNSSWFRDSRIDFGFEVIALHNLLMQTRLEPPQAPEMLFSMSFGPFKVRHGDHIFHKDAFLQGFLMKSSFIRFIITIIPTSK